MKHYGCLEDHYLDLLQEARVKIANLERELAELKITKLRKRSRSSVPDARDVDLKTLRKRHAEMAPHLERYFFLISHTDYRIYRYANKGGFAIIDRSSTVIGQGADVIAAIDSAMGKVDEDVGEFD